MLALLDFLGPSIRKWMRTQLYSLKATTRLFGRTACTPPTFAKRLRIRSSRLLNWATCRRGESRGWTIRQRDFPPTPRVLRQARMNGFGLAGNVAVQILGSWRTADAAQQTTGSPGRFVRRGGTVGAVAARAWTRRPHPATLWGEAAELASRYGVNRTARALGSTIITSRSG